MYILVWQHKENENDYIIEIEYYINSVLIHISEYNLIYLFGDIDEKICKYFVKHISDYKDIKLACFTSNLKSSEIILKINNLLKIAINEKIEETKNNLMKEINVF